MFSESDKFLVNILVQIVNKNSPNVFDERGLTALSDFLDSRLSVPFRIFQGPTRLAVSNGIFKCISAKPF